MTPLSEAWFAEGRRLAAELPPIDGLSYAIELRSATGTPTWHQEIRDGQITAWGLGARASTDLVLQVDDDQLDAIHDPDADGTAVLAGVRVVGADGALHLPAPLDITESSEIHDLPTAAGADLRVQYHLLDGPFGAVDNGWVFIEGRFDTAELGVIDDPDVEVWAGFAKMAALRRGEITAIEALEDGGRVDGGMGPLMLLAGLQESEELHRAQLATGNSGQVLSAVGQLRATDAYRAVLSALADGTV